MTPEQHQDLLNALEQPLNDQALSWVATQNSLTTAQFAQGSRFQQAQQATLHWLNDKSNIPWVTHYRESLYNFWQDEEHPRGIWRRTNAVSYQSAEPEWETVLDLDQLNQQENSHWSFHGAQPLYPDYARALIYLSSGGDACEIREFDLVSKTFINDGFFLPVSKSRVSWVDENTLLLSLDAGGETLTSSGYPRCVRRWQRGTSPESAPLIYAGEVNDLSVSAWRIHTPGYEKELVYRGIDFYRHQTWLLKDQGQLEHIAIPDDATAGFFKEWLLVTLTSRWQIADEVYPAGALLAINLDDFQQGKRHFTTLFTPDAHTTLNSYSATRDYLLIDKIRDVVESVSVMALAEGEWQTVEEISLNDATNVFAHALDNENNRYALISHGFLQPRRLSWGDFDRQTRVEVKQDPASFDATNFAVTQHFALSLDGTPVPYFQVSAKNLTLSGDHPTLLNGYGGFEVSLTPSYLGAKGATWLQKGGVYVVANIRGGGEYGPQWHQAALKEHRHRAYEDFAAVAADLVARNVTCPARLAARGGSNGGLLIGNMLTDYPAYFGALVCEVPLLDMANYHRWLAGASWIAEYGDPDKPEEWQWLKNYSPFDKVQADKTYPPTLFTTGTRDDRVSPAHARKMVARMQQQGHQQVWLYEETEAGHGNAPEKGQIAFKMALVEEFLWQMLMGN
ncbi:MAG: prolyl oligopeptidase family serine peptidase [Pantoea sp.]|uniref:prolyl oligopeptidase family serine peptidase n=1 Tax=Pantoea sp. TaxID=69393 RepID=UPI0039E315E9